MAAQRNASAEDRQGCRVVAQSGESERASERASEREREGTWSPNVESAYTAATLMKARVQKFMAPCSFFSCWAGVTSSSASTAGISLRHTWLDRWQERRHTEGLGAPGGQGGGNFSGRLRNAHNQFSVFKL